MTPEPATLAQLHLLRNALAGIGIKSRPDRLTATSVLACRELASSKELTKEEATRFIDRVLGMPVMPTDEFEAERLRLLAGKYDPWAEVSAA